jgi:hypothetical protein
MSIPAGTTWMCALTTAMVPIVCGLSCPSACIVVTAPGFASASLRGTRPFAKNAKERGTHFAGRAGEVEGLGHPPNPQSWNLYSYVLNQPTTKTDPDGHSVTICSNDQNGNQHCQTVDDDAYKAAQQTDKNNIGPSLSSLQNSETGSGVITNAQGSPVGTVQWTPDNPGIQTLGLAGSMGMAGLKAGVTQMALDALGIGLGRVAAWGIDAALAARAAKAAEEAVDINNLSNKIVRQMTSRGWTKQEILDTVREGDAYSVTNKATGGPATEYVSRSTGKFVVIDDNTGQVLQVSRADMAPNHWVK